MEPTNETLPDRRLPTKFEAVRFRAKTAVFQARHWVFEKRLPVFTPSNLDGVEDSKSASVIAESRTALRTADSPEEFALQAGKIQNLRVASAFLDKIVISAGEIFSFWAHVPRPTRHHGFVDGRELREGCIVPSIGGGLCQLSNSLYDCALKAGLKIVERHGHSRKVPGSLAEVGRDATIFWNYVDLKFRADCDWQLRAFLTRDDLVVQIVASPSQLTADKVCKSGIDFKNQDDQEAVQSCESCGMTSCFRHPGELAPKQTKEISAWAVDAYTPEFGAFLYAQRTADDWLFTPLSSSRKFGVGRYPWSTTGFNRVVDFPLFALHRSLVSRRLSNQGAERQKAMLRFHSDLAKKMIRQIPHQAGRIVVSLELLPYFWKAGVLGGRQFDVLMTRWPIYKIQEKLDQAAARWPESPTLADFRVDAELADLEREALAAADSWITAHPGILKLADEKQARTLNWVLPKDVEISESQNSGGDLIFPATTAGRNGAWDVREAVRTLKIPLKTTGPNVEGDDFWKGCAVEKIDLSTGLQTARALVFPAWIASRPNRVLVSAVASGLPIITTDETGICHFPNVVTVPTGDPESLAQAISRFG